jgi:hypothetical protein
MAKQPIQQRFRISCEVDVADLGPVMVALAHIEGLVVTGSELVTDVRRYKQSVKKEAVSEPLPSEKPYRRFDTRAEDVILTYARRNHGKFTTNELVQVFAAEGRARNSLYATIDALMKSRLVKRTGKGRYALLQKAAKSKPGRKAPKAKTNGAAIEGAANG